MKVILWNIIASLFLAATAMGANDADLLIC